MEKNGTFYNKYNNTQYEIKNGNGKVIQYNINGNILFEGEYI